MIARYAVAVAAEPQASSLKRGTLPMAARRSGGARAPPRPAAARRQPAFDLLQPIGTQVEQYKATQLRKDLPDIQIGDSVKIGLLVRRRPRTQRGNTP